MKKGPVSSALSPAQPCQTPTWIGNEGRLARAKLRGCPSRRPANDPLFIFGIADGWPVIGADSYCPPVDRLPHIAARQSTLQTLVAMLFQLSRCRLRRCAATWRSRIHNRLDAVLFDSKARTGTSIIATRL